MLADGQYCWVCGGTRELWVNHDGALWREPCSNCNKGEDPPNMLGPRRTAPPKEG